ncbi:MAG TPA: hypothetical protein DEA43_01650 [Candidatus Moranbacteria bacterium]|nr:hypothetical protein [Candidatus Moranbacteria bacterium]HBT45572.1 hypothetical protein [Candidatus Moranbacteria bacterium]
MVTVFFQTNPEEIRRKEIVVESAPYTPYYDAGDEPINIFLNAEGKEEIQPENVERSYALSQEFENPTPWFEGKERRGIAIVLFLVVVFLIVFFSFRV